MAAEYISSYVPAGKIPQASIWGEQRGRYRGTLHDVTHYERILHEGFTESFVRLPTDQYDALSVADGEPLAVGV